MTVPTEYREIEMEAIVFSILQMEIINLLLTERGILARGRGSTDRVSRDPYKNDRWPIFPN